MKVKVCVESPIQGEFSLCGDAFDAPETDGIEPFVMAKPGQRVTCEAYLGIMMELRRDYTPKGTMKKHC